MEVKLTIEDMRTTLDEAVRRQLPPIERAVQLLEGAAVLLDLLVPHGVLKAQEIREYLETYVPSCCTPTAEEKALLAAGVYTPEELWGASQPSCPKCAAKRLHRYPCLIPQPAPGFCTRKNGHAGPCAVAYNAAEDLLAIPSRPRKAVEVALLNATNMSREYVEGLGDTDLLAHAKGLKLHQDIIHPFELLYNSRGV